MTEPLIAPEVYAELAETMGADFAAELVATFLSDAPNMIADLKAAAAGGDADGYRRAAHSIKSNADTFGAPALAAQARAMELGGLPEGDPPLPALEATYAETAVALKALADA
ncbi:histidine kinase [Sulfitobacter sp. JBTF-M27]|jgi:HPt (histidine-containing phosphotransfer) domain-containing protein|uniref:Histidine kinase n=1 Tax=Sulfitobacter sediminilitoris TaxID=2698830 RepID=A0A6P0CJ01_9RHOB|nr:Hpt domain-containing protein [Sulfitobacter sediminilitoris]NEK24493.1 histidine kinase [Sulfitobacter sediminilitoris]